MPERSSRILPVSASAKLLSLNVKRVSADRKAMADSALSSEQYSIRYPSWLEPANSAARKSVTPLPEDLRILIVDDDPFFRSLLKVMLRQAGLTNPAFMEAEDSGEAIRICQTESVEMVFCDLNLPVLRSKNGLEIIRQLRMLSQDVPLYMVTADCSETLIEKVRDLGATGHILKPINLRILKRILVSSFYPTT